MLEDPAPTPILESAESESTDDALPQDSADPDGSSDASDASDGNSDEADSLRLALAREIAAAEKLRGQVEELRRDLDNARLTTTTDSPAPQDVAELRAQLIELNDAVLLQQVGIYEYRHPLDNAAAYKTRLADLRERIRNCVTHGNAVEASNQFAYNNSLAKGRRMTADLSKMLLRGYNAEADNCVRSLRIGALDTAIKRLNASAAAIAKLGSMMQLRVSDRYHALRIEELELTADYLFKVQEEKEAAREERERLREEKQAERELATQREKLDKERAHYANALASVQSQGTDADTSDLQAQLDRINAAIELNDYRIANIRAGYVYVISNIGSFGPDVVKIGLTRRLDPMDRVRELGDASVPFRFDVHALYFSKDAVTLENELHEAFAGHRVNQINIRREFFFATPTQVREILADKVGNLLEFTDDPEADEYFQSSANWPRGHGAPAPGGNRAQ